MRTRLSFREILNILGTYIPVVFSISAAILFLLFALFNTPIADDFAFYYNLQSNGYLGELASFYMNESGRFTHGLVTHTGYTLLNFHADKILPLITWAGLVTGLSLLLYQFKLFNKRSHYVIASVLITTSFLFAVPSLFDSFLWYTASYATSLVFLLLDLILLTLMLRHKQMAIWKRVLIWLLMIIGQMYFELTGIVTLALISSIFLIALLQRRFYLWKVFLPVLTSLVIGLVIVLLSPAFVERRQAEAHVNIHRISHASLSDMNVIIHSALSLLPFILVLASGLFFAANLNMGSWKKQTQRLKLTNIQMWLILLGFFIMTVGLCLIVKNYAHGGEQMYRTMTVPSFGVVVTAVSLVTYGARRATLRFKLSSQVVAFSAGLLLILATPLALHESYRTIQALSLRQYAVRARSTSLHKQIADQKPTLTLTSAPINLKSNAFDCFYEPAMRYKDDINWVCVTYLLSQGSSTDNFRNIEIKPSSIDYRTLYP